MPADPPRPQTIVAQRLQRFEIIGDVMVMLMLLLRGYPV
jgi:hypothetical protein